MLERGASVASNTRLVCCEAERGAVSFRLPAMAVSTGVFLAFDINELLCFIVVDMMALFAFFIAGLYVTVMKRLVESKRPP